MTSYGVLLVSETRIKNFTNVHQNVDTELLLPNIQIAQDLGGQMICGGAYYNELILQVSGNTLTTTNREFLENFMGPYLIWRAYYESLPLIYMRMMNKTIVVGNTEEGSAIGISEMKYLRGIAMDRYEFYQQRILDEFRNFPNKYPTYYRYNQKDGVPPQRDTYFSGIQFEPGFRYPPRTHSAYKNLPKYYGGEFDCYDC
jgi:hypothetical protein